MPLTCGSITTTWGTKIASGALKHRLSEVSQTFGGWHKLRSLVRKWQALMEATTDNYTLRMFCIGFSKRRQNWVKRTCYAPARLGGSAAR
ncbi:hypothetical protein ACFX1X_021054 [Malus domestica]